MKELLNKIHHADCLDLMKGLPNKCVDLVVTSPPYDSLRDYNNSSAWSFDIFTSIADQLERLLQDSGCICWNVSDQTINGSESLSSFKQAIYFVEHLGLRLHDTMIYQKPSFSFPESNRYPQTWEYIFVFSKGAPKTFNPIKDRKNIYSGEKVHGTSRQKDGTTKALSVNAKKKRFYQIMVCAIMFG